MHQVSGNSIFMHACLSVIHNSSTRCKTFPKSMHTSMCIAQDIMVSREPRLNVHTNQFLVHSFSLVSLIPLCLEPSIHLYICVLLLILLAILTICNVLERVFFVSFI